MTSSKIISFNLKIKLEIEDADYNLVWTMDNNNAEEDAGNMTEESVIEENNEGESNEPKQEEIVTNSEDTENDSKQQGGIEENTEATVKGLQSGKEADNDVQKMLIKDAADGQNTKEFTLRLSKGNTSQGIAITKSLNSTALTKSSEGPLSEDFFKTWIETVQQALGQKLDLFSSDPTRQKLVIETLGLQIKAETLTEMGIISLLEIVKLLELNESLGQPGLGDWSKFSSSGKYCVCLKYFVEFMMQLNFH